MSLGSVDPMSKPSSRKRCGVSACVSRIRAESLICRARALTTTSGVVEDLSGLWATAKELISTNARTSLLVIVGACLEFEQGLDCIGSTANRQNSIRGAPRPRAQRNFPEFDRYQSPSWGGQ